MRKATAHGTPARVVLDASAVIGFLLDEPARPEVEALLRQSPPPLMSAVNLAEAIDKLVRGGGLSDEQVTGAVDLLIVGGLEVQPFWLPDARRAADLRARFYHRSRAPLSLADCACVATALAVKGALATADRLMLLVANEAGLEVIELPSGRAA